jgi:hypothetical protein
MLFSLYWGSRSPKVPKKELIPDSQSKSARDLSLDREAKKKLKLIAATAMACLTLTVKVNWLPLRYEQMGCGTLIHASI